MFFFVKQLQEWKRKKREYWMIYRVPGFRKTEKERKQTCRRYWSWFSINHSILSAQNPLTAKYSSIHYVFSYEKLQKITQWIREKNSPSRLNFSFFLTSKCPEKWLIKLLSHKKKIMSQSFWNIGTLVILCTRVLLCTVVVCCCLLLGVLVCCCVLLPVRGVSL